jgi:hypothetical protein
MKYLKTNLLTDFQNIVSTLKSNIYLPIFQLISQIYTYHIDEQLNSHQDSYLIENQGDLKDLREII